MQNVVITEFLRPENSHEGVIYSVDDFTAEKLEQMNVRGLTVCVDILPSARCRAYVYDPIAELCVDTTHFYSHAVARSIVSQLIRDFDLSSYP